MKRITSIVLCTVLLLSCVTLTACTGEDPQTVVNEAMAKLMEYDTYEVKMLIETTTTINDTEVVRPTEKHLKIIGAKSDKPEIYLTTTLNLFNMSFTMHTYTDSEDWAYVIIDDDGCKMSVEEAKKALDTRDFTKMVFKYPPMVFKGLIVTKNADGSKTVQFDVANDLFHQLYTNLLEDMNSEMGTTNINDIRVRNAHVKITVADGNVRDYDMTFDISANVDGETKTASVKLEIDYIAFGDDVVITPPEGYLDFPPPPKAPVEDGSAVLDTTNQNSSTEE